MHRSILLLLKLYYLLRLRVRACVVTRIPVNKFVHSY